jgi:hypothetical protein
MCFLANVWDRWVDAMGKNCGPPPNPSKSKNALYTII